MDSSGLRQRLGPGIRFARGIVGRELRMIEMKKEVNELCHRLGEVARYPLEFEQDGKESPDSP